MVVTAVCAHLIFLKATDFSFDISRTSPYLANVPASDPRHFYQDAFFSAYSVPLPVADYYSLTCASASASASGYLSLYLSLFLTTVSVTFDAVSSTDS
jgi:hypothetical protein